MVLHRGTGASAMFTFDKLRSSKALLSSLVQIVSFRSTRCGTTNHRTIVMNEIKVTFSMIVHRVCEANTYQLLIFHSLAQLGIRNYVTNSYQSLYTF